MKNSSKNDELSRDLPLEIITQNIAKSKYCENPYQLRLTSKEVRQSFDRAFNEHLSSRFNKMKDAIKEGYPYEMPNRSVSTESDRKRLFNAMSVLTFANYEGLEMPSWVGLSQEDLVCLARKATNPHILNQPSDNNYHIHGKLETAGDFKLKITKKGIKSNDSTIRKNSLDLLCTRPDTLFNYMQGIAPMPIVNLFSDPESTERITSLLSDENSDVAFAAQKLMDNYLVSSIRIDSSGKFNDLTKNLFASYALEVLNLDESAKQEALNLTRSQKTKQDSENVFSNNGKLNWLCASSKPIILLFAFVSSTLLLVADNNEEGQASQPEDKTTNYDMGDPPLLSMVGAIIMFGVLVNAPKIVHEIKKSKAISEERHETIAQLERIDAFMSNPDRECETDRLVEREGNIINSLFRNYDRYSNVGSLLRERLNIEIATEFSRS